MEDNLLLSARGLSKEFLQRGGIFKSVKPAPALNSISFSLEEFETLGVVGESGCGKTTLAKIIARLIPATRGELIFNPRKIGNFRKDVQIIFQNPYNSLNPKMRVSDIIFEPLQIHKICPRVQLKEKAQGLLSLVGLEADALGRRPHQFSGGQRQRIAIARALACEPKLLILDEPISSLDLIIQAQMMELFIELKKRLSLTYIFISHNLAVVRHIADRLMVMHGGQAVETGKSQDIFAHPQDPYTKMLLEAAKS